MQRFSQVLFLIFFPLMQRISQLIKIKNKLINIINYLLQEYYQYQIQINEIYHSQTLI